MFQSGTLAPTPGTMLIMLTIILAYKDLFYGSWEYELCLIVVILLCRIGEKGRASQGWIRHMLAFESVP